MAYYQRKSPRIPNYDYSNPNYYFITICTHQRKCIFGTPKQLNQFGEIAKKHIQNLQNHYVDVRVDQFVVMPNHIHMILILGAENRANIETIIAQYKAGVSREIRKIKYGINIWQRSFHDHVIRDRESYLNIWKYIEGNPLCWEKDCFFTEANNEG